MLNSFFNISDLNRKQLTEIMSIDNDSNVLNNKNIGLIFEKYSTRTRLSFKVGINQLEGNSIDIRYEELNISREESFEDTFKAFSCYLDGLVFRTTSHQRLINASKYFNKPIINALSEQSHPCQILGDLLTLKEVFGSYEITILWMGDMNNVCYSLVEAANLIEEINLIICTPISIAQDKNWIMNSNVLIINDVKDIDLKKVNCVMTDVFVSMNDNNNEKKVSLLRPFCVDIKLISKTASNSVFMHCLPAKVGFEVSEEVFIGPKSIVWRQAHNRLAAQKKLLQFIYQ